MTFTLHSLGPEHPATDCFFSLQLDQTILYSPFYPDKTTAILAMQDVVQRLRSRLATSSGIITKKQQTYAIQLFGNVAPTTLPDTLFTQKTDARRVLDNLCQLAQAETFPLIFVELHDLAADLTSLSALDLSAPQTYVWQEVSASILRVERKASQLPSALGASVGLSPATATKPCEPIFNVLQPQVAADLPFFLGRKREVEDLHALTLNNPLLLLYGPPRVGKTSLIQCGLANRLEAAPGELIVHRRGAEGMLPSFEKTLRAELEKLGEAPLPAEEDPWALLTLLNERVKKPVFLVFDQLESLFHAAVEEGERNDFFVFLQRLLNDDQRPCRIILSLRENFLAPLADYERHLPALLTHRYRVQSLSKSAMMDVSLNLLDLLGAQGKLTVDQPELVADKMLQGLSNKDGEVPFQCLQIFLQEAHQKACMASGGAIPDFNPDFIDGLGSAREVIDAYIANRIATLQDLLSPDDGPPDPEIRQQIADLHESRQQCGCADGPTILPAAAAVPPVAEKRVRNLRWLLLLSLLALLLSLLAYWFVYNWAQRQDPCYQAKRADTCEAYVNYLLTYGEDAPCATGFRTLLAERQCAVWRDYELIQQTRTCGTYQAFFTKYRHTSVSTDHVQKMLLNWGCTLVRDTVQITVHDTVFAPNPQGYEATSPRIKTPASATCQDFGGSNFKKVGPLWIMTDPLPGGPYTWEEGLDACKSKGWRLPCIGEIEFLLENIYRGEAERAYQMLAGAGACYLVNPAEAPNRRIEFWTGTESNDAFAWSFFFDTKDQVIGRESNLSKTRRLPCLCVKRETSNASTGLPPCYNKTVDRRPG